MNSKIIVARYRAAIVVGKWDGGGLRVESWSGGPPDAYAAYIAGVRAGYEGWDVGTHRIKDGAGNVLAVVEVRREEP